MALTTTTPGRDARHMIATITCWILGSAFLIAAIWGYINVSRGVHDVLGLHVNHLHNTVHLITGLAAIACAMASERAARLFSLGFGATYLLVALLGFMGVQAVIDLLHLNRADDWFHLIIAAVFLTVGALSRAPLSLPAGRRTPGAAGPRPA